MLFLGFLRRHGEGLRCGRLPRGSLLYRQEVQGQRPIDHVRPLAERHLDDQHRRGDDHVQRVREVTGESEPRITQDVRGQSAERRQQQQDGEDQILHLGFLVDSFAPASGRTRMSPMP